MATPDIASAGLYTDFSGLAKLRAMASSESSRAGTDGEGGNRALSEVAEQFEALFLQDMLKAMRDASTFGESTDSDQTRFYLEMFDKQVAIDLATRSDSIGLSAMLERELGGGGVTISPAQQRERHELLLTQFERAAVQSNRNPDDRE